MPQLPLSPHELMIGNYVQCQLNQTRYVRVMGIRPGLLLDPPQATNYLVDVFDPETKLYGFSWHIGVVSAAPVTGDLLQRIGFDPDWDGSCLLEYAEVYTWPIDSESCWAITFDLEKAVLWTVTQHKARYVASFSNLHQLQNLLSNLDGLMLRLDNDPDTIAADIATQAINKEVVNSGIQTIADRLEK